VEECGGVFRIPVNPNQIKDADAVVNQIKGCAESAVVDAFHGSVAVASRGLNFFRCPVNR